MFPRKRKKLTLLYIENNVPDIVHTQTCDMVHV